MKRRDFLRTSAAAASLVMSPTLVAAESDAAETGALSGDNRAAEYLRRVRGGGFLPRSAARTYPISPMPLAERVQRGIVPKRGFCSIAPGDRVSEALISGNGAMSIELMGDPYSEQVLFRHEALLMPWKRPLEAPEVADILPQVRQLALDGKSREAMELALQHLNQSSIKPDTEPHLTIPAFLMQLESPKTASVKNYLRTVNFENSEIGVVWTDERGDWLRRTFTSRPDHVVVQWLTAPAGQTVNVRIALRKSPEWNMASDMDWGSHLGIGATDPDLDAFTQLAADRKRLAPRGVEAGDVTQDANAQQLIYKCVLDSSVDNSGYAGVVRVVRNGGSTRMDGSALVIENASSVLLLTRIDYFPAISDDRVEALRQAVEQLTPDYPSLLERHQKVQSEMLNRVTVDFGGASQYGMSAEELLADQRSRPDYSPALLERVFEMGRHWFILNSGKYPSIAAGVNATMDLQTAGAAQGALREGMAAYFDWMDSLAADHRANARNVFGCRGASYSLVPDKGIGVNFFYTSNSPIGAWPYWISAGGLRLRPFWEHYLVSGDVEFLRDRVVPAYKELALFYADFLTARDKDGNYIFVPSISPENTPNSRSGPVVGLAGPGMALSGPALINATMDIAVCREVLTNLIQACQTLGTDADSVPKWKAMLAKMPPYLMEADGTLKEWSWPTVQERYAHRHVSHLYGVWPGDEIDPDRTPPLARAARIASRRRTFDVMSTAVAGETLAAYARCHRALVGARLKDRILVDVQLRQLVEQGYVSSALRCSREPHGGPSPDAQAGIPAIVMEMLLYSRPGVIEILPALPPSLVRGSISGMHARTFARIDKLAWDMDTRTVDLTVTSATKQDVTLIARQGVEQISASGGALKESPKSGAADCSLRLPAGQPVEVHLKLARREPLDWADRVTAGAPVPPRR